MIKNKNVLIIGYGSAGQSHVKSILKIVKKDNIFIFSQNKNHNYNMVKTLDHNLNSYIDYVVISNITSKHLRTLETVDKIFKKKIILIEKPLGTTIINKKFRNNIYYVGYNLRYHPLLIKLKKLLKGKKIFNVNISCLSYLPDWRTAKKTYSHFKAQGGGVEYDLSHEIDYLLWLFGDVLKFNTYKHKLTNITNDSNDICCIHGMLKSKAKFQILLTYFSKINQRKLIIDTENNSYSLDLLKNNLVIKNKYKKNVIHLPKFDNKDTYYFMHKNLFEKKNLVHLPDIAFNNKTQKIINNL